MGLKAKFWTVMARRYPKAMMRLNRARGRFSEREQFLISALADPTKTSIDIGANAGYFLFDLRRHSRRCIAFEPVPHLAAMLRKTFPSEVTIHQVALSDHRGSANMRLPVVNGQQYAGYATIEANNTLTESAELIEFTVDVQTLDDFEFRDIAFLKIDVEGHELAVLQGAEHLLKTELPNIYIEAENRHRANAVATLEDYLKNFGYSGYFLKKNRLRPISEFDPATDQMVGVSAPYINNFIFLNEKSRPHTLDRLRTLAEKM